MTENENIMNAAELNDAELEQVSGGKHSYITGDDGKSHVRKGPGLNYASVGVLHKEESARYLHETSTDDRGIVWYKIRWDNKEAWVSSLYTKKERF